MRRYEKLWKLPRGERIHAEAFKQHRISAERLQREGVDAKPEVGEFLALVSAALAAGAPGTIQRPATPSSEHHLARPICSTGVRVIAHHASFDVARLNHTAHRHGVRSCATCLSFLPSMYEASVTRQSGRALCSCPAGAVLKRKMYSSSFLGAFSRFPPDGKRRKFDRPLKRKESPD